MRKLLFTCLFFLGIIIVACGTTSADGNKTEIISASKELKVLPGAHSLEKYVPLLEGKRVAVVCNQTSEIKGVHLVDTLRSLDINIVKAFAPEHGFRGDADAGETVKNQKADSGIEIISLYGENKKPSEASLEDVDIVVFDIQDVGVRFYTYLSTLHYVMEACAENGLTLILLDRPNPHAHYVDGPVLKTNERSFVGLHPVPIVYGLTIGEYAGMINGEGWLANSVKAKVNVIACTNYSHSSYYKLPIPPSPNLPNMRSVELYPSLALFEGTVVSVGRGTDFPFQVTGHPSYPKEEFSFTPTPGYGAKYPKLDGQKCYGKDLRLPKKDSIPPLPLDSIRLSFLIDMYEHLPNKKTFFLKNKFFNKLSGTSLLMSQIKEGISEEEIKESWEVDLNIYLQKREKYLIYQD